MLRTTLMRLSGSVFFCTAAALLAGLVYLNALENPFIYDDYRTIIDNRSLVDLWDLRAIVWRDVARPLTNLSFAVDYRVWGGSPFGFHASSIALHMLNVALLFHLTRRLVGTAVDERLAAFAAATIFAVHPLMTQAVGYISGRSEVLCAAFFLSTLLAGRRWMVSGGAAWWSATVVFWIAATMTKETGVVAPALLFAMDRLFLDEGEVSRRRRLHRLHLPLWCVAIGAAVVRAIVVVNYEQLGEVVRQGLPVIDAMVLLWRYFGLLLMPTGQSIFHEIVPVTSLADPRALLSIVSTAVVLAVAWRVRGQMPILSFGLTWFFVVMLPSAALVAIGLARDMAEQRLYLASGGPFLAAGAAVGWIAARPRADRGSLHWIAALILAAVLLPLSGRTLLRNAMWSSPVALWVEAVERNPGNWLPLTVLGESFHAAGRHEEAVTEHRAALQKNPEDASIYMKLGLCLSELGRFDAATALFEELLARNHTSPTALAGLGIVAVMSGHPDRAQQRFKDAITNGDPDLIAHQWLATLEENVNRDFAAALKLCEEVERRTSGSISNAACIRRNRARLAANAR